VVLTEAFGTEPYLVRLGDRVVVAGGVQFITHDGAVALLRGERRNVQTFAPIAVGDDTFIGQSALVLPGTTIGRGCLIGAGSVVRGVIPENAVVIGNPARVVGRASLALRRMRSAPGTLDSFDWTPERRRAALEAIFPDPQGAATAPSSDPSG
jgi:tetrahydrodipicolinate N-succinyltransferase